MNNINVETESLEMFKKQIDKQEMYADLDRHKTNHTLHVILTVVTFGMWIFGWCIVASNNCDKRNVILKRYNKPLDSNIGFHLFVIILAVNVITFWGMVN